MFTQAEFFICTTEAIELSTSKGCTKSELILVSVGAWFMTIKSMV